MFVLVGSDGFRFCSQNGLKKLSPQAMTAPERNIDAAENIRLDMVEIEYPARLMKV